MPAAIKRSLWQSRAMSLPVLRGLRLELTAATSDDLDFLAALNSDPEVMAHISGGPATRLQTEKEWSRRLGERTAVEAGLGYWIGSVDGEPIGWWGLGHTATEPDAGELGFRLSRAHWRRGLATEGAYAVLRHAFVDRAVLRVWAGTSTANLGSRRTLAAAGLACTGEPFPGVRTYDVTAAAWRRRVGDRVV
jgi:RimJ/RimL family protein N-acetyltransferase